MARFTVAFLLVYLAIPATLFAQRATDPAQRYFRLICLVHLKGTGQDGEAVLPEYVSEGRAVAKAAEEAAIASSAGDRQQPEPLAPKAIASSALSGQQTPTTLNSMSSRPGILGWRMVKTDDGTMAIIQLVAADHHAFDSLLSDKRSEIRVFEIGRDKPETIQTELQKYRKDFDLATFRVVVR
jgi:hypothetical protein